MLYMSYVTQIDNFCADAFWTFAQTSVHQSSNFNIIQLFHLASSMWHRQHRKRRRIHRLPFLYPDSSEDEKTYTVA